MKKPPPPSRLHPQEPSNQSPPRPPPPPLHQQEPSYQSPPRPPPLIHQQEPSQQQQPPRLPPPPLHRQEPSYQSPPRPPPPPLHRQEPSQAPRPRVTPPTSTTPFSFPPYTSAAPNNTSEALDDSRAMEMYAELEKTKPRVGFAAGGVETTYQYHHQNLDNQPPNLSPRTASFCAELFSTMSPQDWELLNSLFPSPTNQQRHHGPPTSSIPQCDGGPLKRPRFDLGHGMHSYVSRDEDRGILRSVNDARGHQTPSLPSQGVGRFNGVGGMGRPGGDSPYMPGRGGVFPPDFGPNGNRALGFGQQDLAGWPSRELLRLPPDASSTLFVEGLPSNCSMREVAHIFRPFSGYKEVRLVTKGLKQRNGDPIVLCFVDFENPTCAATARNTLQGYRMDEEERDSKILQIQFSRNPGPRPGQRGGRR